MKIAILGAGPLGLEVFHHFKSLEADCVIFGHLAPGEGLKSLAEKFPHDDWGLSWNELTSKLGREKLSDLPASPTFQAYFESYFLPLWERAEASQAYKQKRILRVHKTFLDDGELPESRLKDLFRVVYQDTYSEQDYSNQMPDELAESLKEPLESFEDFDIVMDTRGDEFVSFGAGPNGNWAINEQRTRQHHPQKIVYGRECLDQKIKGEACLVGTSRLAALFLLANLKQDASFVVVTQEERPFERLYDSSHPWDRQLGTKLDELMQAIEIDWKERWETYEEAKKQWNSLEDFKKVKTTRPKGPVPKIRYLCGANIMAIDFLSDRDDLYLSLESPDFRATQTEAQTIKTQKVLVFKKDDKTPFCLGPEPGFYVFKDNFPNDLEKIAKIEENLLQFFSRKA